jgi:DNA-binding MarR family transcriptional regulator
MTPEAETKGAIKGTRAESPTAFQMIKLAKRLTREFEQRFAPLGIHAGQDRLLEELWHEDGLRQSELIGQLSVEPPTVTGILQRMERDGLIERRPDSENRRVQRVYLTEAGRQLEKPVRKVWREVESTFLSDLSASDRRQLLDLLAKLAAS